VPRHRISAREVVDGGNALGLVSEHDRPVKFGNNASASSFVHRHKTPAQNPPLRALAVVLKSDVPRGVSAGLIVCR
jgi:hypothetical protein